MGARWTDEDEAEMLRMRQNGSTFRAIADELDRNDRAVLGRWRMISKRSRGWTQDEDSLLMALKDDYEHDWRHIASRLGRTVTACRRRHYKLRSEYAQCPG